MDASFDSISKKLKAISDPKRLKIIEMLSCGELCACVILESFNIAQPTLSHDMKVLVAAELVTVRRDGRNTYYKLNHQILDELLAQLQVVFNDKKSCICHHVNHVDC